MDATKHGPLPDYILGLDLGMVKDFTALAVLERRQSYPDRGSVAPVTVYAVRHLKRWTLGTRYPDIVADVAKLVEKPPLVLPALVVDQTGVGQAVMQLIQDSMLAAEIHAITITGGHEVTAGDHGLHVPKKELVSVLQVLLQSQRLMIAKMPDRETLVKELLAFKVKITASANETFEAWRERDHDDMVLAVALAAWWGERCLQDPGLALCAPRPGDWPQ